MNSSHGGNASLASRVRVGGGLNPKLRASERCQPKTDFGSCHLCIFRTFVFSGPEVGQYENSFTGLTGRLA